MVVPSSTFAASDEGIPPLATPRRAGHRRLRDLGELGRGGRAGSTGPAGQLKRRVALKRIFPGSMPARTLERFRNEARRRPLPAPEIVQTTGRRAVRAPSSQEYAAGGSLARSGRHAPAARRLARMVPQPRPAVHAAHGRASSPRPKPPTCACGTAPSISRLRLPRARRRDHPPKRARSGDAQLHGPRAGGGQTLEVGRRRHLRAGATVEMLTGAPFKAPPGGDPRLGLNEEPSHRGSVIRVAARPGDDLLKCLNKTPGGLRRRRGCARPAPLPGGGDPGPAGRRGRGVSGRAAAGGPPSSWSSRWRRWEWAGGALL